MAWLRPLWVLGCALLLASCGGADDNQRITQVQVKTLAYSQQAVIYLAGIDLRHDMTAVTSACKDPSFSAQSVPQLAILNCTVTELGVHPLSITGSGGQLLYSGTLTVPQPQVTLVTSKGNVVMELDPAKAPITVNNFLAYVNKGAYARTLFHRVIAGFIAQGGGYTSGLVKISGQSAPITLESNKGLSNIRASVAMARTSEFDSATSEFYFNLVDNPALDYKNANEPGYAVFGKVVQGMDVVDAIGAVPTGSVGLFADVPTTEIAVTLALQTQ